ncbi:MAG: nuclear transport factor 2 family protein [Chloroflexi bacterium]|nr:nuclear transport factor 2 family protein [Chloroflexota bacterium]MCZ6707563.1 nuclear transport factor 2 family protein [Chloroflexota bacterium]
MDPEDRFAIQDLIADYAFFWDNKDADGWAGLFTPDGVWELYLRSVRNPVRRLTNVGERITAARSAFFSPIRHQTRLYHSGLRFDELTEDHASVRSIILVVELLDSPRAGTVQPLFTGTSSDTFRKTPIGWRFTRREIHGDQSPGFGDAQDLGFSADAVSD